MYTGYGQSKIVQNNRLEMMFTIHHRLFQIRANARRLKSTPVTFQPAMNVIISSVNRHFAFAYSTDIAVFSKDNDSPYNKLSTSSGTATICGSQPQINEAFGLKTYQWPWSYDRHVRFESIFRKDDIHLLVKPPQNINSIVIRLNYLQGISLLPSELAKSGSSVK